MAFKAKLNSLRQKTQVKLYYNHIQRITLTAPAALCKTKAALRKGIAQGPEAQQPANSALSPGPHISTLFPPWRWGVDFEKLWYAYSFEDLGYVNQVIWHGI